MRSTDLNKYDVYLFLLIASLAVGNLGGALQPVRILALLLVPSFFSAFENVRRYKWLFGFLLFWLAWLSVSMIWTPYNGDGLKSLVYYCVHFLLLSEICLFATKAAKPHGAVAAGWIFAVLFTSVFGMWEIITDQHLSLSIDASASRMHIGSKTIIHHFASTFFGNLNSYVTFLCFALPFVLFKLIGVQKIEKKHITACIALFLLVVIILFNGSRGGVISVVIMLLVALWMRLFGNRCDRNKQSKHIYKRIGIISAVVVVGAVLCCYLFPYVIFKFKSIADIGNEARFGIWRNGLQLVLNTHGLGTGVGGVVVSYATIPNADFLVPHNLLLELLVESGVLVFALFLALAVKYLIHWYKMPHGAARSAILLALIACPFYFIIDSTYWLSPATFCFFASLIIFAYERSE
ncbi:MAG: O-antigen ligase family protein [Bacteroidales bacterium]|nr:O-antigen ligase family protein [Candidatus Colimorpha onthohippi]